MQKRSREVKSKGKVNFSEDLKLRVVTKYQKENFRLNFTASAQQKQYLRKVLNTIGNILCSHQKASLGRKRL
jgi:hypothetical protein